MSQIHVANKACPTLVINSMVVVSSFFHSIYYKVANFRTTLILAGLYTSHQVKISETVYMIVFDGRVGWIHHQDASNVS